MNLRFKPTSIQGIINPATKDTAFLWFHSIEVDVGIVIESADIIKIRETLNEIENEILKKNKGGKNG